MSGTTAAGPGRRERAARLCVTTIFFIHGAVFATWAARIPAVTRHMSVSTAVLGLVLAGPAVGALLGSQAGGRLVTRFGSRAVSAATPVALCLPLALVPTARSPWPLLALLIVMGAADGATSVAMNDQGVAIQQRYRRPILNSMHAARSVGAGIGAAAAALMLAVRLPLSAQFPATAAGLAALSFAGTVWLLPRPADQRQVPPRHGRRHTGVVMLAVLAFLSALVEDAPASWGGVYLRYLGASTTLAAITYGCFATGQIAGRLMNDRLVGRFGWVAVTRAGAAACVPAVLAALVLGNVAVALLGFTITGLCISAVFPAAFAAAGRLPHAEPGVAMGQVGFAGNLGWLAVSPVIGAVAGVLSLPAALGLLPAAAAGIAACARAVAPADDTAATVRNGRTR